MQTRNWAVRAGSGTIALAFALSIVSPAYADDLTLKKGTDVKLVFDSPISSETAKPGDTVMLHVEEEVDVDGKPAIAKGTNVIGTVKKVTKRKHYGVNAKIQLEMSPVKAVNGQEVPLGFKTKTKDLSRPGEATGATLGGAAVLGPLGLAAGYFVVGKKVNEKPGDKLTVTTDEDTTLHLK